MSMNDLVLVKIDAARRALAEANSIADVKELLDQATAIQRYLKQKEGAEDAAVIAGELKLRAERKLGELIPREIRRGGSGKNQHQHHGDEELCPEGINARKTLKAMGISGKQSSKYQQIAKLPAPVFEQQMAKAKQDKDAPTTAGILRIARRTERKNAVDEIRESSSPSTVDDLGKLIKAGEKFGTIYADPPWRYGNTATRSAADG